MGNTQKGGNSVGNNGGDNEVNNNNNLNTNLVQNTGVIQVGSWPTTAENGQQTSIPNSTILAIVFSLLGVVLIAVIGALIHYRYFRSKEQVHWTTNKTQFNPSTHTRPIGTRPTTIDL